MEFSFQQFICKQKSNLRLKINEGHYESDKFFFSKNYPSFQADVFRRRKFDFYHAILYQSHCYIYPLFNLLSYLLNQLNPPLNGKLYKRTENISIFLRMKLCTCSTTSFSSDCDRFVFLKSKKKRKYINY